MHVMFLVMNYTAARWVHREAILCYTEWQGPAPPK